jgi:hypothetical protein
MVLRLLVQLCVVDVEEETKRKLQLTGFVLFLSFFDLFHSFFLRLGLNKNSLVIKRKKK